MSHAEAQVEELRSWTLTGPALEKYAGHATADHGEQVVVRLEPGCSLVPAIAL